MAFRIFDNSNLTGAGKQCGFDFTVVHHLRRAGRTAFERLPDTRLRHVAARDGYKATTEIAIGIQFISRNPYDGRIVDIDGTMALQGTELYAASYQGRLVAIDIRSGRRIWQRNVSSVSGVGVGFGNVYVADDDGTVSAFLRNGQGVRWQNIDLGFRDLSRPTPVSSYVAVVDFEGYLHLLSQVDGDIVGRTKVDSSGARADMLVRGNRLFVYTNDGTLKAYDVETRN